MPAKDPRGEVLEHLWRLDEDIVPVHTHDDRSFLMDVSDGKREVLSGAREAAERVLRASPVSRRSVLAGMAACGALTMVDPRPRYAFAADPSGGRDVLVVVFLRGGADGLQAVVPYADPGYAAARPTLAIRPQDLLVLDERFGLHPKLAPLKPLWDARQLAIVPAVGNPAANRSHFDAQLAAERAAPAQVRSGWVGRHLSAVSAGRDLTRAVTFGDRAAVATSGAFPTAAVGGELSDFEVWAWEGFHAQVGQTLTALAGSAGGQVAQGSQGAFAGITALAGARATSEQPSGGASYPPGSFGRGLREAARVIRSGAPVEVVCLDLGDWDMHARHGGPFEEWGAMARKLTELSEGLAAFRTDLGEAWARTSLVTMSEFGRRVAENSSGGSDHGRGGVMFVAGGGIRGGLYGTWPGLSPSQLQDGDVAIATDYRQVLAELLTARLGATSVGTVFPGLTPAPLGLAAPR